MNLTKAETLEYILKKLKREKIKNIKIPKFIFISKKKYLKNKKKIFNKIKKTFKNNLLIIRSSSKDEDNINLTNAGKFLSFQKVRIDEKNIYKIIDKVIIKFKSLNDQILIQSFINNAELSGVIFTREANFNSPYYIINYDSSGKPSSRPYINTNYFWHSDKSYLKKPSLATLLYPVILPLNGGDTQLAHMGLALEALPDVTRTKINNLKVIHSIEFMRHSLDNPPPTKKQILNAPPVSHPIIKKHPETNQNCLYIGMYASHIENLPIEEGRLILARLQEQSTQPPFIYNHKWQKGDLLIWDNRCLIHSVNVDYPVQEPRIHLRTLIKGNNN